MTNVLLDRFKPAISRLYLMREMTSAESAWMDEVREVFGDRDASMMRFKDRGAGKTGTRLNSLYLAFVASRDRYKAS